MHRRHYYPVHAAENFLCNWKPCDKELQQTLHITCVEESARWMGSQALFLFPGLFCICLLGAGFVVVGFCGSAVWFATLLAAHTASPSVQKKP